VKVKGQKYFRNSKLFAIAFIFSM